MAGRSQVKTPNVKTHLKATQKLFCDGQREKETKHCTLPTSTSPSLQALHPPYKHYTLPTSTAPSLQALHPPYKHCTLPTSTAPSLQALHSPYKHCTLPTSTAPSLQALHLPTSTTPSLQALHPPYKHCTLPTSTAPSLQAMHPPYKHCTLPTSTAPSLQAHSIPITTENVAKPACCSSYQSISAFVSNDITDRMSKSLTATFNTKSDMHKQLLISITQFYHDVRQVKLNSNN